MAGKATLSLSDLSALGPEDRMAVMNMVKEGEVTIDEAIAKVKGEALLKQKGGHKAGINRRGAMKKYRGRLNIDISIQKGSAFSVLVLSVKDGRDLLAMNAKGTADPYLKVYLLPDASKQTKKKTTVHKGTRNPIFNEQLTWEIRTGTDLESKRLHISVWDDQTWKRNQFMGAMSFSLAEIWDPETTTTGWFKLLDEKKGEIQNIPYRPKRLADQQAAAAAATPAAPAPTPSKAPAPEPAPVKAQPKPVEPKSTPVKTPEPPPAAAPNPKPAAKSAASALPAKLSSSSFNYTKLLGQGSFGKVLLAELKGGNEVFAIKVIKKEAVIEDDDVDCTMTERRVLSLSSGSHFLTRLHATFQSADRLYFVMEFINGGDLMFHIQNQKVFKPEQAQFYAAEICSGLWYLHDNGIIYRDLKLDNVMLDHEGHIKIADFGMCKENMFGLARTTTFCGTPGYLAPEIVQELPYGASVDFWSLGVLMFEMLVGDSPFDADDDDELFDQILNKKVDYPRHLSPVAKSFVDGFMTRDPNRRLGCGPNGKKDIQAHAFFGRLDWKKLENRELPPPFRPNIKNPKEANNFDSEFTDADPTLTPTDPTVVKGIDQDLFNGFSFVNPNFGKFRAADGPAAAAVESTQQLATPVPLERSSSAASIQDLRKFKWYRPDLPRQDVAQALKGQPPGTFYVRESSSQPGCYALAMSVGGDKPWNGLITPTVDGAGCTRFRLFVAKKFESLPELITFYCSHAVTTDGDGKEVCLRVD